MIHPQDLPVVGRVLRFGPDDPLYDSLILLGPVVLVVIRLFGRNTVTEALAAVYVASFLAVLGSHAVTGDD